MTDLLTALALALFMEGAVWALFPGTMKKAMLQVMAQPSSTLRLTGVAVAAVAVGAVWLLRP